MNKSLLIQNPQSIPLSLRIGPAWSGSPLLVQFHNKNYFLTAITIYQTYQACVHLRAFALAASYVWNAFIQGIIVGCSLTSFQSSSHLFCKTFPIHTT